MIATAPLGSLSGDRTMSSPAGTALGAPPGDAPEGDAPAGARLPASATALLPRSAALPPAAAPPPPCRSSPLLWPHAATQQPSMNTAPFDRMLLEVCIAGILSELELSLIHI